MERRKSSFAVTRLVPLLRTKNREIRVNVVSPGIIDTPTGSAAISGLQVGEEQVKLGVVDSIPIGGELPMR